MALDIYKIIPTINTESYFGAILHMSVRTDFVVMKISRKVTEGNLAKLKIFRDFFEVFQFCVCLYWFSFVVVNSRDFFVRVRGPCVCTYASRVRLYVQYVPSTSVRTFTAFLYFIFYVLRQHSTLYI